MEGLAPGAGVSQAGAYAERQIDKRGANHGRRAEGFFFSTTLPKTQLSIEASGILGTQKLPLGFPNQRMVEKMRDQSLAQSFSSIGGMHHDVEKVRCPLAIARRSSGGDHLVSFVTKPDPRIAFRDGRLHLFLT